MSKKVQVWIVHQEPDQPIAQPIQVMLFKLVETRGSGWHPVTGWVDEGEDFLTAAQREVEEETAIPPESGQWVELNYSHIFEGRWGRAEEHAFALILGHVNIPIHLDPSEITEFKWASPEEAKRLVGHETQRDALETLLCYLEKR